MAGFVVARAEKKTKVEGWLAEASSILQAPRNPAAFPKLIAAKSGTQPKVAPLPAHIMRMYAKRPRAWGYVCRDDSKVPLCEYFSLCFFYLTVRYHLDKQQLIFHNKLLIFLCGEIKFFCISCII
jgi:hypothetical protein